MGWQSNGRQRERLGSGSKGARFALALAALAGCSGGKDDPTEDLLPQQQGAVLEGFSFGWEFYNHRLSRLAVAAGLESTEVGVIGGTSTTNVTPELPAGCEQASCNEFPFFDTANVTARWAVVETERVALVPMTVQLEVGRDGASATASGELPQEIPGGSGIALVTGIALDTDHPLSGDPDCYNPAYGWHPRQLTVSLGEVSVSETQITVPVDATFAAGKTFDPDRQCIDAVNERAVVAMEISLLVAYGETTIETQALHAEAAYAFSGDKLDPGAQPDPAPSTLAWGISDPVLGFSSIDFRFDPERTDDRGAYLRTLGWWADPSGEASAVATNFSPGTQLEDFAYRFDGTVVAIEHQGTVTRGTTTEALPAQDNPPPSALPH